MLLIYQDFDYFTQKGLLDKSISLINVINIKTHDYNTLEIILYYDI